MLKRFIGIIPTYYFVAVLYIVFVGTESLKENLLLAPVEILGFQSFFTSIFEFTHNGGTWFVSCLLLCYLLYPYIQELAKQMSVKSKVIAIVISAFILLWSPFIVFTFKTGTIYANPLFRGLEFLIGVLVCSIVENVKDNSNRLYKLLCSKITIFLEAVILVLAVTIAVKLKIAVGNFMLYSWIALPMFALMLVSLSGADMKMLEKSRCISYLASISFTFYLAQFFVWDLAEMVVGLIGVNTNLIRIVISLLICLVISVLLHEIVEKNMTKFLKKRLVK